MKKIIFLAFTLSVLSVNAQKIDETASFRSLQTENYFRFNYNNDYFANRDRDYTQGYSFTISKPWLTKNPVNTLFFNFKNSQNSYGLTLEHIGFTPNNYVSEDIQLGDRPFASAIYLKSFKVATSFEKNQRFVSAFSFGIIGPGAFGKEMQVGIHEWSGNEIPKGWQHQIKNDVVLNYELTFEKEIFQLNNLFAVQGVSTLQLGTLFTNISIGSNLTLGLVNNVYKPNAEQKGFKIYAFFQPKVTAIAYDATLQGGLFNTKSSYTILNKNIERLTAEYNYGFVIQTRGFYLEYSRAVLTSQFKNDGLQNGVVLN